MQPVTNFMSDCIMNHPHIRCSAIIPLMATAFSFTSCIFEAPGDEFYRTMWNSSEVPLGPIDIDELTIEFLCGNRLTIKDGSGIIIAHGSYNPDGRVATFSELSTIIDDIQITFIEAHLNEDILFLLWRPEDMFYPYTTAFYRKVPVE